MPINTAWLDARIAATQASIDAYEAAEVAIASGALLSYTLDTGQTLQTVTKMNITELRRAIDALYNRYATLCARRDGGATQVQPSW